jgi:hypothetical protein
MVACISCGLSPLSTSRFTAAASGFLKSARVSNTAAIIPTRLRLCLSNYRLLGTKIDCWAAIEPLCHPARLINWSSWGRRMYLRGNPFGPSTSRYEDYRLAGVAGIVLAAYAAFFFVLYWSMQPTVTSNSGLAGYRPPPKTIVKYADAPWEPATSSEALPIGAVDEPAPVIAKRSVTEEPKKETKKQEGRTTPRQARPVREQPNPFWGYASSRSFGSRPWF